MLPGQIESLEATQAELTAATSQTDFYQQEQQIIAATLKSLSDVSAELEQAYERWAVLEEAKSG